MLTIRNLSIFIISLIYCLSQCLEFSVYSIVFPDFPCDDDVVRYDRPLINENGIELLMKLDQVLRIHWNGMRFLYHNNVPVLKYLSMSAYFTELE